MKEWMVSINPNVRQLMCESCRQFFVVEESYKIGVDLQNKAPSAGRLHGESQPVVGNNFHLNRVSNTELPLQNVHDFVEFILLVIGIGTDRATSCKRERDSKNEQQNIS